MRASRGALALFVVLAVIGVASATYVLVQQRLTLPGTDTYEVAIDLAAADGVAPGLGQPVRVAGVKVGSIADARLHQGRARVTLELERDLLPDVYRDARAALVPITPLKDMQVELDPGRAAAGRLPEGGTIRLARTSSPGSLAELLSALDHDTRDFLTSLIANLDLGTRGRADGVRQALRSLGPATSQVRSITTRLDRRRRSLARLVRNLGTITAAAGEDQALRTVVASGQDVLHAVAREDRALDAGLRRLPGTLTTVRRTLRSTAGFTRELTPTLDAITPATDRLPQTLGTLEPFARETASALRSEIRPLVREAQPLVRRLARAVTDLHASAPALTTAMRVANYALNELAYNPPGDDEGLLFWFPWWFHNYGSMFGAQDAHGSAARAMALVNCQQLAGAVPLGDILNVLLGTYALCRGN
jgi:phospholipid/cholesterol/gamma-HCH transport system substrate-binding protein